MRNVAGGKASHKGRKGWREMLSPATMQSRASSPSPHEERMGRGAGRGAAVFLFFVPTLIQPGTAMQRMPELFLPVGLPTAKTAHVGFGIHGRPLFLTLFPFVPHGARESRRSTQITSAEEWFRCDSCFGHAAWCVAIIYLPAKVSTYCAPSPPTHCAVPPGTSPVLAQGHYVPTAGTPCGFSTAHLPAHEFRAKLTPAQRPR